MRTKQTPCASNPDKWFRSLPSNRSIEIKQKVVAEIEEAVAICHSCPVRVQCLIEGMKDENLPYGIWGGLLSGERLLLAGVTPLESGDRTRHREANAEKQAFNLLAVVLRYRQFNDQEEE